MIAAGYSYNCYGENIAAGYGSPASVMVGWMNSSGHRSKYPIYKHIVKLGLAFIIKATIKIISVTMPGIVLPTAAVMALMVIIGHKILAYKTALIRWLLTVKRMKRKRDK